jgi:hypothetical protein
MIRKAFVLLILLLTVTCSEKSESLDLSSDYLTVTDLLEFCKGSCDTEPDWENKPALVMGHITGIENDSILDHYRNSGKFFIEDIRNGMSMGIWIINDTLDILNIIDQGLKTDCYFFRGITGSVLAYQGNECTRGVVLLISKAEDINKNTEK